MSLFTLYPAIDLREGRVVRLVQGDPDLQTVFSNDPALAAQKWLDAGASWLHVVNLDGAFEEPDLANWAALQGILTQTTGRSARVQFGGGLRSLADLERLFELGVERAVLGTSAILQPELVAAALDRFGAMRIAVALDVRDGRVSLRGWQQDSSVDPLSLSERLAAMGVGIFIYTSIARDGTGAGADAATARQIKDACGAEVIASGGVHTLDDIRRVRQAGLDGLIVGRALYDRRFTLAEALAC